MPVQELLSLEFPLMSTSSLGASAWTLRLFGRGSTCAWRCGALGILRRSPRTSSATARF